MMQSLLLPGTLCDARVFGPLADRLADPAYLDHRGFADAGEAAAALLPAVPAGSLGIAFSLGGWVLLEMAVRAPDRFAGLVLLAANAHADDPANADGRRAAVEEGRATGLAAQVQRAWPSQVGASAANDEGLRNLLTDMAVACGHDVHARQAALNIARPDHRAALSRLPMPVHVVAGAEDRLCPADRYRAMAEAGATLHLLPGVGHFVPLEAPDAVAAVIGRAFPGSLR